MEVKSVASGTLGSGALVLANLPGGQRELLAALANSAAASSNTTKFVHPGVVNSQADYDKVVNFINSNALPTSFSTVVYAEASGGTPTANQIRRDCLLAYTCALHWVKTVEATNFQRYDLDAASGRC